MALIRIEVSTDPSLTMGMEAYLSEVHGKDVQHQMGKGRSPGGQGSRTSGNRTTSSCRALSARAEERLTHASPAKVQKAG